MLASRRLVAFALFFLVTGSRPETADVSTSSTAEIPTTEGSREATSTTAEPSLCETCACTDTLVNCTDRKLEHHFHESQWPSEPLEEVSFEANLLVRLKPFPSVTIKRLVLRGNGITMIDDKTFLEIKNLTELDLSHNRLTSEMLRPAIFQGKFAVEVYEPLAQLRVLNLASNALRALKQDIFEHVPDLRVLVLSGNPLRSIDQGTTNAISQLLSLEELDLGYCDLGALPDHLFHAPRHLKRLNLNGNGLKSPPRALEDCKALEYLSLDENPFEILERTSAFPLMPSLRELNLSSLPRLVSVGERVFSELTALESVSLQNCPRLEEIDEDAFVKKNIEGATWPPLKKLDLSDNALRYLPSGLVGRWDRLEKLVLINNEWCCDCDNQYLIGILLPSLGKALMGEELDGLECRTPPEHAGKYLTSLSHRKLRCSDKNGARPERDAAILVGVLIGLLLAIPVALTAFVFWRRGFFFCGTQGPATFSRAFYKRAANDDEI